MTNQTVSPVYKPVDQLWIQILQNDGTENSLNKDVVKLEHHLSRLVITECCWSGWDRILMVTNLKFSVIMHFLNLFWEVQAYVY